MMKSGYDPSTSARSAPVLNLYQLKAFLAVAKHRSFSRASAELYLTQPAVSKQIKALEELLGVELFYRVGRAVHLTEAGEALRLYTQRAFQSLEEAVEAIAQLKGLESGHLKISAASTIGIYLLPQLLGFFKRQYPGVEISLAITNKESVLRGLLNFEAELGFVGPPVNPPELVSEEYLVDELVLIMAPGHRLAFRESVSVKELQDEIFILRERGSGTREIMEEELARLGINLKKAMELGSTEAIKQAVAADLGVSIISKYAITMEVLLGRLCSATIPELNLKRQLYLVYHRQRPLSRAAQAFRDLLRKATHGEASPLPG